MINLIVACGKNRVIGRNGKLPWAIKEDWEYFLEKTTGGVLIMGRNCFSEFESYAQEREVIVLTRNPELVFKHAQAAHSLQSALLKAQKLNKTIWICGGERIYEEAMPLANLLYITQIDRCFEGDVFFPEWEKVFRREIFRKEIKAGDLTLQFLVYEK